MFFEYPNANPYNLNDYNIVLSENAFKRTVAEDTISSLIFFLNYKFKFTKNKLYINNDWNPVYIFCCNDNDKFYNTFSGNFVTSSSKTKYIMPIRTHETSKIFLLILLK